MSNSLKKRGYTLMGMAITLAVVGLMTAAAVSRFTVYYHDKSIDDTRENVAIVMDALTRFVNQNGYYPCPAPLKNVANDVSGYGLPTATCNSSAVATGAVPFRVLNIPQSVVKDAYDTRLVYAVTSSLTDKETYTNSGGGIGVVDGTGSNILPQANAAHFVVLSHGRDRSGAYSSEGGINTRACNSSTKDAINCDGAAIFRSMPFADLGTSNENHFDDYLGVFMSPDLPIWLVDNNDSNNIWYDLSLAPRLAIGYPKNDSPKNLSLSYNIITAATKASPVVITTSVDHGLSTGDIVYISGVVGMTELNNKYYRIIRTGTTTFSLQDMTGTNIDGTAFTAWTSGGAVYKLYPSVKYLSSDNVVSSSTNTSPIVVTTASDHGFMTGDKVLILGSSLTSLNGFYRITKTASNKFSLQDLSGNNTEAPGGTASSSGIVIKYPEISLSVNGDVKISNNIYAQYICDSSTNDRDSSSNMSYCVKIDDLFSLSCSSGYLQSVDGYGSGSTGIRLNCATIPATMEYRCPAGKVISSVSTTDGIVCSYPATTAVSTTGSFIDYNTVCASRSFNLCGSTRTTGIIKNGDTVTLSGLSTYQETYKCLNREFVFTGSAGSCDTTCDATEALQYSDFAFYNGGSKSSFSGLWDVDVSNQCSFEYRSFSSATSPDDIQCEVGERKTVYEICPDGEEGYVEKNMDWGCSPNQWNTVSSTDNCSAITSAYQTNHCPEGIYDTNGDGTCDACLSLTQTRKRKLHSYTDMEELRSLDCTTRKWTYWHRSATPTALARTWTLSGISDPIGPVREKGSNNRLGDTCYDNNNTQRACYMPIAHGHLDLRPLYYQYQDCICK